MANEWIIMTHIDLYWIGAQFREILFLCNMQLISIWLQSNAFTFPPHHRLEVEAMRAIQSLQIGIFSTLITCKFKLMTFSRRDSCAATLLTHSRILRVISIDLILSALEESVQLESRISFYSI